MTKPDQCTMPMALSRRSAIKTVATTLGAVAVWPYLSDSAADAFAVLQAGSGPPKPVFLTPEQYAMVDALSEAIIPADDHSPGARAARVAAYIDLLLAESDQQTQDTWTGGLAALDAAGRQRFGESLPALTPMEVGELVAEISRRELDPRTPLEHFFVATKSATIRGYYTSEIGIHQELDYKGNKVLREFVGCRHPEHGFTPSS